MPSAVLLACHSLVSLSTRPGLSVGWEDDNRGRGNRPNAHGLKAGIMGGGHTCSWHLELEEVGGRFPVLIIPDPGAAREPDGDAVGSVSLRFGEFSPCDLPHGGFLSGGSRVTHG